VARSIPRNGLDYLQDQLLEALSPDGLVLAIDEVDLLPARGLPSFALVGELQLGNHGRVYILKR
jgi:hypothetical protein